MTISLRASGQADKRDITVLEETIGQPLSSGFKEFVGLFDGFEPEANVFRVNVEIESGVNGFIPVQQIIAERSNIENIADQAYPFAWAEGGN